MADASSEYHAQKHEAARITGGRLVLIVGPSGAGKDTLIDIARAALHANPKIEFPSRVVTRASSTTEENIVVSSLAFAANAALGLYSLSWHAHGLDYGVPRSIEASVQTGMTVVVNVSRRVIPDARTTFANVAVAYIDAPVDLRAMRLAKRGRETKAEVTERLATSDNALALRDADIVITNDAAPEIAGRQLIDFISH
jgi:ribose 1,5-bisphosphokinase